MQRTRPIGRRAIGDEIRWEGCARCAAEQRLESDIHLAKHRGHLQVSGPSLRSFDTVAYTSRDGTDKRSPFENSGELITICCVTQKESVLTSLCVISGRRVCKSMYRH